MKSNLNGNKSARMTTDSGYFSEDTVTHLAQEQIDGYVATGRIKHGDHPFRVLRGGISKDTNLKERMSRNR